MGRHYNELEHERSMEEEGGSATTSEDERIIYFSGDVSETSVSQAIAAIFALSRKNPHKPIYLVIETYGGSVDSMFALYDAMKFVSCPVHTIALGKVMSAGVLILAAGHKGDRLIAPHARVMTHPAWGFMHGNVFEIKHELQEMERQEKLWLEAMVRETGQPINIFKELNARRDDQYLTPAECIDLGIADNMLYEPIARVTKAKKTAKKRATKSSKKV